MIVPVDRERATEATNHAERDERFLELLPAIHTHASIAFRDLPAADRDDAVEEVLANAFVALSRLFELGKADLAYAGALARYGVTHVRTGRRVGTELTSRDVLSQYAQQKRGFTVQSLDGFDEEEEAWREVVVEDKRATPAEVAAVRLDFTAWLASLPRRLRRIAGVLVTGETTSATAKRFQLSRGRISQLRKELAESWESFQGEPAAT